MQADIAGLVIEVDSGVTLPYRKIRLPRHARLDFADRLTLLIGKPAKRMYVQGARVHDWETLYQRQDIKLIRQDQALVDFKEALLHISRNITVGVGI